MRPTCRLGRDTNECVHYTTPLRVYVVDDIKSIRDVLSVKSVHGMDDLVRVEGQSSEKNK